MDRGAVLIEQLLGYAQEKLELNEYDVGVKRDLLIKLFNLKPYKPEEVPSTVSFEKLKEKLIDFAKENGLANETDANAFCGLVFGVLLPLPSHVNKKFRTLREKFGAGAACDYLYGLSVSSGQISGNDFSSVASPYFVGDETNVFVYDKQADKKGFEGLRSVFLDLNGKSWRMSYTEPVTSDRQCVVSASYPVDGFADVVCSMLDFIEYLPDYSASVNLKGSADGTENFGSTFFAGTTKYAFNGKPDFTAFSEAYPDVEITAYDGDFSAISMQSFNRNTLERLATETFEKWLGYSDDKVFGRGADGVSKNDVYFSVKYSQDNRYVIDASFSCDKADIEDKTGGAVEYSRFGNLYLGIKAKVRTETACAVLTRKIPADDSLFAEGATLYGLYDLVNEIILENGYFKDFAKAENVFKRAYVKKIKAEEGEKSAFASDDDGTRSFKSFLMTCGIK